MNKISIFITILAFLLLLNGCTRPDRYNVPASQKFLGILDQEQLKARAYRKQYFDHTPKGEDSYSIGFQNGCQTATSVISVGIARTRGPNIDVYRLLDDPWYLRGYQDAKSYCTHTLDWETH